MLGRSLGCLCRAPNCSFQTKSCSFQTKRRKSPRIHRCTAESTCVTCTMASTTRPFFVMAAFAYHKNLQQAAACPLPSLSSGTKGESCTRPCTPMMRLTQASQEVSGTARASEERAGRTAAPDSLRRRSSVLPAKLRVLCCMRPGHRQSMKRNEIDLGWQATEAIWVLSPFAHSCPTQSGTSILSMWALAGPARASP